MMAHSVSFLPIRFQLLFAPLGRSLSLFLIFLIGCGPSSSKDVSAPEHGAKSPPERIVCTSPSLTETAFALGLGPKVVGVSRFCEHPPEAASLPNVGGHIDPHLEAMVTLKPDLVLVLEENAALIDRLKKLGIPTLAVCHRTIDGILASFTTIGRRCGVGRKAKELNESIEKRLQEIAKKTAGAPRRRVLIAVDRSREGDGLRDVYIAGNNPFFVEATRLAGGVNVGSDLGTAFPVVSFEGILQMKPEVVVELAPVDALPKEGKAAWKEDWRQLGESVPAIRDEKIHVMTEDYAMVPGPRFIRFIEDLAARLHPDIFDEKGAPR
jgi:iron complex transport system substrate-binding protein